MRALIGIAFGLALLTSSIAKGDPPKQIGEMVLDGIPEWDTALRDRLLQYLQTRSAGLLSLSDDAGSALISTRFGETSQMHVVAAPLAMRRQITFFDEPVRGGFFRPASGARQVIYATDVGGNEARQFFLLDLQDGRSTLLTDGKARNDAPVASHDGARLAFCGTARNGRDFDIYVADLNKPGEPARLVWEVQGQYYAADFSPDGERLTVQQYLSERETRWFILNLADGKPEPLTPEEPAAYYGGGVWSADGKTIYITSDREGEFRKLYAVDLASKQWRCLSNDWNWDVEEVAVDPTGKRLAFTVNVDGVSELVLLDADGANPRRIQAAASGVISGIQFSRNGAQLGLTISAANGPADAYTVSMADGKLTRWTESEIGGLNPSVFTKPELIHYPTFDMVDGKPRMIPAFYYKAKGDGPRPVVILCHGGPESQYQPTFSSNIQFWVNELGISVLCPNVRGSTGYGRSYHQLDNAVKREDSVKDVGALLDWIEKQPELDAARIGIYGGSYGGYMVLGSLTNYPERFKAGIDVVGIADFVTFLQNTSEYRRDLRRAEYGDERDPEVRKELERISPLRNAHKITSRLLVAHGANDPRVPVSEAEQIVAKMRELGRTVWYAKALNEGHGFARRANTDLTAILYAHFWREHLLK